MPPFSSSVTAAATLLAARRKTGEQGPRLPESCRPSNIDTALAIQAAVSEQLGERIGAWKCGISTSSPVVMAPIHAGTIHCGEACSAWAHEGKVRIEPELAFILGHDLPAREIPYTPVDVDAAIARTHLALELIDSRYVDPLDVGILDNLADGLLNQGLFIGPEVDAAQAALTGAMPICIQYETGEEIQLEGRHPNTHPRAPLYWLAEFLRSQGRDLRAGQAIITGSYAGTFDIPADQRVVIRYGELGVLTVRITAR
jgi:2-keto-4-pentenoate hydratase